ncbi:RNA polymerase II transcriptional coactivator KELP [Bienertia sinuspersici]
MDAEISDKIQITVTDILKSSDLNTTTEEQVRELAAQKLGIDLSDLPHKVLVRQVVESFLLSTAEEGENKPVIDAKQASLDSCRLSEKRDVAVINSAGKTAVSIRELTRKDGKAFATPKCTSLALDEWSVFQKSIPAIEEAIEKAESRLRSEIENKQVDDKCDISVKKGKQIVDGPSGAEPSKTYGALPRPRQVATSERAESASTVASTPQRLVPIGIIRFDGKNYEQWAKRMKSYLNQLKVSYVLSEPCPSAVGVEDSKLTEILSVAERWVNDDHMCHQNILNSLCDHLFAHYMKKSGTAKDLWEELKLMYLEEEHGANVSLVKNYIEFQIVEEKSVFKQVDELNQIADALQASGMHVEEKFHVNVIISKLPASWKPNSIELMKEDYLPMWMLMNHLKAEEESRQKLNRGVPFFSRGDSSVFQPSKKPELQRFSMKKPRVPYASGDLDRDKKIKFCSICKKKGHNPEQCWYRKTED